MAGRIDEEDIATVRQRARIDEIVSSVVALRNAGGGSLKGLCPFHDEKTPSFTVTPARGFFYCFGCGEGGDVITFVCKHHNLSFVEAVQYLADRVGIVLRIIDDGSGPGLPPGLRKRVLDANLAAAEFFAEQLASPEALTARKFLDERGFDQDAARLFGVGYAPKGGRAIRQVLGRRGFDDETLKAAGLIRDKGWDFFSGRLLWPIRDAGSSVLGFGARRIFDDDRLPAKYINTPETPVYKKSQVLYGLDLARKDIGKRAQVVVVEGYTDVMAAHLAGVDTAVASCGTAFGDEHARLLQRLMGTHDGLHGEVIFTFDGDAAGQKAALKVFSGDQNFVAQTYVAVEPSGLDPCDLRLQQGDAAVRELVGRRVPLYSFVMANLLQSYDLERADGRLGALRAGAGLLSAIRDKSLVDQYLRELAKKLGMDIDEVRAEVGRGRKGDAPVAAKPAAARLTDWPDPDDRELRVERDSLKLMLQHPMLFDEEWNSVEGADFTHRGYRAVFELLVATPLTASGWQDSVRAGSPNDLVEQLVVALLVEPLVREPDENYATAHTARLRLARLTRDIAQLKSRLQRTDPVADPQGHAEQFAELTRLEITRKQLLAVAVGE